MKRYIQTSTDLWPESGWFKTFSSDDLREFESEVWEPYLEDSEEEVNELLEISVESSSKSGPETILIHDDSGKRRAPIEVDYRAFCNIELELAANASDAYDYQKMYRKYISTLIRDQWGID